MYVNTYTTLFKIKLALFSILHETLFGLSNSFSHTYMYVCMYTNQEYRFTTKDFSLRMTIKKRTCMYYDIKTIIRQPVIAQKHVGIHKKIIYHFICM